MKIDFNFMINIMLYSDDLMNLSDFEYVKYNMVFDSCLEDKEVVMDMFEEDGFMVENDNFFVLVFS